MTVNNKNLPHYIGHRKRQKEKFLNNPSTAFSDYELVELILFQSIPRRDVKPLAKDLLNKFGTLSNLVNSNLEQFSEISGASKNIFINLKIIKEIINRVLAKQVFNENVISSWSSLLEYLKFNMGDLRIEQFRVLFLNKKNILIADEIMASGTIDQTPVYPREILKRILFHDAGAIILVHNHPSGDTRPSNADIDLTATIVSACKTVNVSVHDHVIISKNGYYSFKTNMLL